MKRYESYKPSGIEWIGEIPSHWNVNRLKFEIGLHGRIGWNGLRSDEFQVDSHAYLVTGQDFEGSDIPWEKCYQIDKARYDEDPFIQLEEGDILVTKDGSIGKVAMVRNLDKPACLNSGIFVLKQKDNTFNQLYLYWLLNSDIFKGFISYHQSGSTILHLYQNVFNNMPTLIPPIEEQIIMADYLAKKCVEVDKSIAKQQRRIKLLEELKQSVITQAVTRGLEPNVHLRDSGIEWIGQIPQHWECPKLKQCLKGIQDGTHTTFNTVESEYFLLSAKNVFEKGIVINDGERTISKEDFYSITSNGFPRKGDILLCCVGTIGRCCIFERQEPLAFQRSVTFLRCDENTNNRFILYVLRSDVVCTQIQLYAKTTAQSGLYLGAVSNLIIVCPPLSEQQAITDYLDKRCAEIDGMIEREKKKIMLMQELKQSIITEVVTGKRKVV